MNDATAVTFSGFLTVLGVTNFKSFQCVSFILFTIVLKKEREGNNQKDKEIDSKYKNSRV